MSSWGRQELDGKGRGFPQGNQSPQSSFLRFLPFSVTKSEQMADIGSAADL
jgi:hypothetical protein